MGAGVSHPTDSDSSLPPSRALHVLRVTPGSPASQTDIEAFFDFVVGVDGGYGGEDSSTIEVQNLERIVESHEGRTLLLVIYSSKTKLYRQVPVIPSRQWSLPAAPPNGKAHARTESVTRNASLLGLSMRICQPDIALDNVWHILEVLEGSPAESAGLVPYGDWIVGWAGGVLHGENDFLEVVEAHVEKPLRVYVYSYDFDTLREVVLVPNRMWGGEGLLGCGVGFGLLHRIPQDRPESEVDILDYSSDVHEHRGAPRDTKISGQNESSLFVPADDIYDDAEETSAPHPVSESHHNHHQYPSYDGALDNDSTPPHAPIPISSERPPTPRSPPSAPDEILPPIHPPNQNTYRSGSAEAAPQRPSPPNRAMTPTGTPLRSIGPTWRSHGRVASGIDYGLRTPRPTHTTSREHVDHSDDDDDGDDEDTEDGTGTVSGSITSVD